MKLYKGRSAKFFDRVLFKGEIYGLKKSLNEIKAYPSGFHPELIKALKAKNHPITVNIKGDLNLSHTNISFLPNNLKVEGNLNLSNTKITSLPNNLKVEGNLNLRYTNFFLNPQILKNIKGNIYR